MWPGVLILATACYVFAWMNRQGTAGPARGATAGLVPNAAMRRFLLLAAALVVLYFAVAPFFYDHPAVAVVGNWIAVTAGASCPRRASGWTPTPPRSGRSTARSS